MFCDRMYDFVAIFIFVGYCQTSAFHWEVFLGIYVTLRLISFALYYDTKLWKCYAVRTVIPLIISGLLCTVVLFVPSILTSGHGYIVIYPIGMTVLYLSICILREVKYADKYLYQ